MIVWLNGTFGVGKTTTSRRIVELAEQYRSFDPEWVGYMLANNLADHQVSDFQQYPSWRRLVPVVAGEIAQVTGQDLVAAQSVLVEEYWGEIVAGLEAHKQPVFHVLLDADVETLRARIDADEDEPERIRPWRHRHVEVYESAREWLRPAANVVIDTAAVDAYDAAQHIVSAIAAR